MFTHLVDGKNVKMPRHPDFEKIYQAFMWRYCKDQTECDEGKRIYYAWLKKLGLDDTKPYEYPQETREKFSWIQPHIQFIKEDDQAKYFKVEALFPLTSMNWNVYTREELIRACRTLIGKHTDLNHTAEILQEVQIVDADYEDDTVECLDRVLKGSKALSMLEKGEILQVSIEADCLRGSELTPEGWTCQGLVFTGKAYLTKDVLPGVPLTRIMPVEKLVESFKGVTMGKEEKEQKTEKIEDPVPPISSTKPLTEMTNDEIAAAIEATSKAIFDIEQQLKDIAPDKQGPLRAQQTVLYAQLDGYRQALTQKILVQATELKRDLAEKTGDLQGKFEALKSELEQLKKPKEEPKQEPKKEPCKCILTKEGYWARFHQLRSEGLDKTDAFRILGQEMIAATTTKKSQ